MEYSKFLQTPSISTTYRNSISTPKVNRMANATAFLSGMEYACSNLDSLESFDMVENILKSKVLTYAIAFAGGAENGGLLYFEARRNLLTWCSIYEGARFVNGRLV